MGTATPESGQFGVGQAEQVGDAHGVEHAAARRGGGGEVGVPVEVQQPGAGIVALSPGDEPRVIVQSPPTINGEDDPLAVELRGGLLMDHTVRQ